MRILLIEDEKRLSKIIKKGLEEQRFAVDCAFDGEEGLYFAKEETYDLIILDVMLPLIDGVSICQKLRQKKITTPILMLTAKSKLDDKIAGLNSGADDYLTKPFEFAELKARIQALIRRSYRQTTSIIKIDDLEIDPIKHKVKRSGKKIKLTPKEFAILEFLGRRANEVVTRTQITEHTWDYNFDSLSNIIDVFIATLRKKIDKDYKTKLIHTIRGIGYKISNEP